MRRIWRLAAALCGAGAQACYSRSRNNGLIVVPAGKDLRVASTFLHEYGHHIDRYWSVSGVPELNGTAVWWRLRGMQALLDQGRVAFDYSRGWNHSVAEIFAEDYSWIHLPYQFAIPWLSPPDETLKNALLAELGGQPTSTIPETPAAGPLVINRSGALAARGRQTLPFGLACAVRVICRLPRDCSCVERSTCCAIERIFSPLFMMSSEPRAC